ncbi:hypothetical protein FGM00_17320 [Aggregatimonas sangjinii]|uniref:Galactose oxidase n=1 Tax=Aggregatimonas sangjinii TaxID=2583587 RepID=A0A5B7SYD4_9FLAO|nr:hypothetical protein [Aggregatimonas sangjinii]QCX01790.1 hypothetical protein FGM00_17320 [Aggregatimonas sangjinii]
MKLIIKFYFLILLLSFASCNKETIDAQDDVDIGKAALKFDFGIEKKTLTAKEWTKRASLDPRYEHTSLVFDNKMWIIGGRGDSETPKNDVRYSYNGINWYDATPNADFPARFGHASAVFQGKMWVVGGKSYDPDDHDEQWDPEHDHETQDDEYSERNDVWSSSDGVSWELVTSNADFEPRNGHTLTVYAGSLWLIGGTSNDQSYAICCGYRDVWKSDDGADWEKVTDKAPFNLRSSHTTLAVGKTLILIGGDLKNGYGEIWYSEDGYSWHKALENPPFGDRAGHSLVSDGELLWLIGGRSTQNPPHGLENDVWYSKNGLDWSEAATTEEFPERIDHTALFFKNRFWVINGRGVPKKGQVGYTLLSDIWSLEEPGCCEIDDITLGIGSD